MDVRMSAWLDRQVGTGTHTRMDSWVCGGMHACRDGWRLVDGVWWVLEGGWWVVTGEMSVVECGMLKVESKWPVVEGGMKKVNHG